MTIDVGRLDLLELISIRKKRITSAWVLSVLVALELGLKAFNFGLNRSIWPKKSEIPNVQKLLNFGGLRINFNIF